MGNRILKMYFMILYIIIHGSVSNFVTCKCMKKEFFIQSSAKNASVIAKYHELSFTKCERACKLNYNCHGFVLLESTNMNIAASTRTCKLLSGTITAGPFLDMNGYSSSFYCKYNLFTCKYAFLFGKYSHIRNNKFFQFQFFFQDFGYIFENYN